MYVKAQTWRPEPSGTREKAIPARPWSRALRPTRRGMAPSVAAELARHLAQHAEAVCRHYLCNGRRTGRYWLVGDVVNTPGRSLYVRLSGAKAGKWVDAATGAHGDLLDLIACNQNLPSLRVAFEEARQFLAAPGSDQRPSPRVTVTDTQKAAQRLFALAQPIGGTVAEIYLRHRAISVLHDLPMLRFHPTCFYRPDQAAQPQDGPALIAAVTGLDGRITGVQRTWLDRTGRGKASLATPRRALGRLLGHGVRFGTVADVLVAGEGVETVLSLRCIMPHLPMVAALSAGNLAALKLPAGLRRLYVACDADAAGRRAFGALATRAQKEGVHVLPLQPVRADFNDDLRAYGAVALDATLRDQLVAMDRVDGLVRQPNGSNAVTAGLTPAEPYRTAQRLGELVVRMGLPERR